MGNAVSSDPFGVVARQSESPIRRKTRTGAVGQARQCAPALRGFSRAIRRISSRNACGIRGCPGRDFHRHRSLKPARCQRISVSGRTTTSAKHHAYYRDRKVKVTRVTALIRRGFSPRSTYRASCQRRNRISASSDLRGRKTSPHQLIKSHMPPTTLDSTLGTLQSCQIYLANYFRGPQIEFLRTTGLHHEYSLASA